eukprot:535327-Prorocentrum_minimum.AAC.2
MDPSESTRSEVEEQAGEERMERGGDVERSEELTPANTADEYWGKVRVEVKRQARKRALFRSSTSGRSVSCKAFSADGGRCLETEVTEDLSAKSLWTNILDSFGYLPEPILGLALGTAGFGGALNAANTAFDNAWWDDDAANGLALASAVIAMLQILLYPIKLWRFWEEVLINFEHPDWSASFGMCGMALMTIAVAVEKYWESIAAVSLL